MKIQKKFLLLNFLLVSFTASVFAQEQPASEKKELEEIVVTATRTQVNLRDAPGAINVITAEDIKDMNAHNLQDIIRDSSGISFDGRTVGGRSVISVRGMESRHSLVLIDGKRISATDNVFGHSNFEYDWIPMESIQRIEIVRGPLSALYGSDAMGGVINIITRKSGKDWHGNVKAGGGFREDGNGGELQEYGLRLGGPLFRDKLGMELGFSYIDNQDSPYPDDNLSELEEKQVFSLDSKFFLAPVSSQTITLGLSLTDDERWSRSQDQKKVDYTDDYDLKKQMYSLGWEGAFDTVKINVNAYRSSIDKESVKNYADGRVRDYPEELTDDVLDSQFTFAPGHAHIFTLGGDWRRQELESTALLKGSDDVVHYGFFGQDEWRLFENRLLLTPGVRWDHHETFGSEVSPRIYALYKMTDFLHFKAGYGNAFRAPSLKQVSEGYHASTGPHTFVGNPDVQPETSDTYEAGLEYFSDSVSFRAMYFRNEIEDLIAYETISQKGHRRTLTSRNIEEARTEGLETELNLKLPYGFGLNLNYTFTEARNEKSDSRLDGKPRHLLKAKLSYKTDNGFTAALRCQYTGDQNLEGQKAPDYSLWHFSVRQNFLKNFEIQAGVDNIGDLRLADKSDLFSYEERGRFFYANLRYSF